MTILINEYSITYGGMAKIHGGYLKSACTIRCVLYDSSKLLYDRVRIISINSEGFMSYSCGKVQM